MIYDVYGVKNPKYNPRSEYFQISPYLKTLFETFFVVNTAQLSNSEARALEQDAHQLRHPTWDI